MHRAARVSVKNGRMALRIEDYALIGDTHTAAVVGRDGSIDWLCLPRFDSEACFANLLGSERNGFWRIGPRGGGMSARRRYRRDTLILETEFETSDGVVRVIDCMPIRESHPEVVRLVEGVSGRVDMSMELVIRFGYGVVVPWVRHLEWFIEAIAGPDGVALWTPVATQGRGLTTVADFTVTAGQQFPFVLTWFASHEAPPRPTDARFALHETELWWQEWAAQCTFDGEWRDAVLRSLITLKALTYQPTGGIVAAATTSMPEDLGGTRNWDYRYCWLRDATLTLEALMRAGYHEEAMSWRDWLLRAVAGDPADLQIMYGPAGERRLDEWEVGWLSGYEGSKPVRVGNKAAKQFQLDVFGEVISSMYDAIRAGDTPADTTWDLESVLMSYAESKWTEADEGIWEVRGPPRQFTHSKMMAWVAVDRAVRSIEEFGFDGPLERWRKLRDVIHHEVCDKGYDPELGAFTQYYGSKSLDASLLTMPMVGFLPINDPLVRSTVLAIERGLSEDGLIVRYRAEEAAAVDGLGSREGAFLACSFWLADCLHLMGRTEDARALFERLLALRNDVGLLSEEYDVSLARQVGNFPQAFSHVSLVNSAHNLSGQPFVLEEQRPELMRMLRRTMGRSQRSARLQGRFLGMGRGVRAARADGWGEGTSRRAGPRPRRPPG
jgi:GH15 family glucan-1,4-alpha-glucosidase